MGSLPCGDDARGGQAGTETWVLVNSGVSSLLFPLSPKCTNLQNLRGRGHCATGPAVTARPGYASGHVSSAKAIMAFPNRLQPQQRRPLFGWKGGKSPRNPLTGRPFPSGTPFLTHLIGKRAASSDFQPCWRDAGQSKSSHSGFQSQAHGFSDV